ncbi:MAG: EF-hand domain-containing protein [Rhodanobacteraceae bacterium]
MKATITTLSMTGITLAMAIGAGVAAAQTTPPTPPVNPPEHTNSTDRMDKMNQNDAMHQNGMNNEMQSNGMKKSGIESPAWHSLDANSDGYISKAELDSYPTYQRDFAKMDTNGDGKVSKAEWAAWQQMRSSHMSGGGQ